MPATIGILGGTSAASPEQPVQAKGVQTASLDFPHVGNTTPVCLNLIYEKNDSISYRYGQKNQSESQLEPLLGNVPSLDWNRRQAVFQNETPLLLFICVTVESRF